MVDTSSGTRSQFDPPALKFKHHTLEKDTASVDQIVEDNYKQLVELLNQKISEPKVPNLVYTPQDDDDSHTYQRANATLMILATNKDINGVIHTMVQIEEKFNSKFHYPYVFLNDKSFTDDFIQRVKEQTTSTVYFETIDPHMWKQPEWIDTAIQKKKMRELRQQKIAYASKVSYHNMCRFYSANVYNHPRMQQFRYYWRFEPDTDYYCQIDYDIFKFMEQNGKVYGFTIALYDAHETMPTLWTETLNFLHKKDNMKYLNQNAAIDFLMEDLQHPEKTQYTKGYSTCHFWSNFEIADMDFYRSEAYNSWIQHLDSTGGFYYERWGDAPVHTIGVSLFADRNDVHWFRDIGYRHHPYVNCPNSDKCSDCNVGEFTFKHLEDQNCLSNWWNYEMDAKQRALY